MNEYSLMIIMARTIDDTKIERIRQATMQMVVLNGFGGASILEIAKKAEVAEGYLYRYYKSKTHLVEDLLYSALNEIAEKLEGLIDNELLSVGDISKQLISLLFVWANQQPDKIKFLFVLMNDYNFQIREYQQARIYNLCKRVKEKGHLSGEINREFGEEEVLLFCVSYPLQFINMRLKNFFYQSKLGEEEKHRVMHICINSLK